MAKFMTKIDICPNFPIIDCNKFMVGVFNSGFPSGGESKTPERRADDISDSTL